MISGCTRWSNRPDGCTRPAVRVLGDDIRPPANLHCADQDRESRGLPPAPIVDFPGAIGFVALHSHSRGQSLAKGGSGLK
jgi:hypothetical protein